MAVTGQNDGTVIFQEPSTVSSGEVRPVYVTGDGGGVTNAGVYELQVDDTDGTTLVVVEITAAS